MASPVTFADIQGSAFIRVLQFTLVNEIHLCCCDGPVAPLSNTFSLHPCPLNECPVYGEMARWRAASQLLSNVMLKKKIFNGLSVAFPALTCQVIRNLSLSHSLPPHPPFPRSLTPSGHDTPLITCYTNRRVGWQGRGRLRLRWEDITASVSLPSVRQAAYF